MSVNSGLVQIYSRIYPTKNWLFRSKVEGGFLEKVSSRNLQNRPKITTKNLPFTNGFYWFLHSLASVIPSGGCENLIPWSITILIFFRGILLPKRRTRTETCCSHGCKAEILGKFGRDIKPALKIS